MWPFSGHLEVDNFQNYDLRCLAVHWVFQFQGPGYCRCMKCGTFVPPDLI